MQSLLITSLALLGLVSAKGCKVCKPNDCLAAVTGKYNGPPESQKRADCSSFVLTTVTPAQVTVTNVVHETVTVTVSASRVATIIGRSLDARATAVVTVPAYAAAACAKPGEYSSACSCWGIKGATVTLPPPVTTIILTSTATETVTATRGPQKDLFACRPHVDGCTGFSPGGGWCAASTDGHDVCFVAAVSCDDTGNFCETSDDCGDDERCQTDSCCAPQKVCARVGDPRTFCQENVPLRRRRQMERQVLETLRGRDGICGSLSHCDPRTL